MKKLVLFGNSKQTKSVTKILEYEGFRVDSFCVDDDYYIEDNFLERPVYKTSEILGIRPPNEYQMFLPLSPQNKCKLREQKYLQMKNLGYDFFTFISKWSFFYTDKKNIGENVFIGGTSGGHADVIIKDNCYISEGVLLGHDTIIGKHSFIGPRSVLCGSCKIGERVSIGANVTIREDVEIPAGSVIGMGVSIHRSLEKPGVHIFSPLELKHYDR